MSVSDTTATTHARRNTLGEVAEKMRAGDIGSALVADYGRLIGILTSRDLLRAFAGRVHPSEARVDDERPTGMVGLRQAARQARGRTGIGLGF